ncbi:MAG: hypothetical protein R2860_05645 [Desulfobacterales bacterium]
MLMGMGMFAGRVHVREHRMRVGVGFRPMGMGVFVMMLMLVFMPVLVLMIAFIVDLLYGGLIVGVTANGAIIISSSDKIIPAP